jgi:hypothetical protein
LLEMGAGARIFLQIEVWDSVGSEGVILCCLN